MQPADVIPGWMLQALREILALIYAPCDGVRPGALSWGEVNRILEWWLEMREGGWSGARGAKVATPYGDIAGWRAWCMTVAQKVERRDEHLGLRCPLHTFADQEIPWCCSAVEAAAIIRLGLKAARVHRANLAALAARTGLPADLREAASYRRAVDISELILRRLTDSDEYRAGMNFLAEAFAEAGAQDPDFLWPLKSGVLSPTEARER